MLIGGLLYFSNLLIKMASLPHCYYHFYRSFYPYLYGGIEITSRSVLIFSQNTK